mgnify:CR=1 FL=1
MKLILKNYKLAKIKSLIKTQKIIFLYHFTNETNKIWIKLEQYLFKKKLNYYKINSSLVNSRYSPTGVSNLIFIILTRFKVCTS